MKKIISLFLVLGFLWGGGLAAQAANYTFEPINFPGSTRTYISGLNDQNQVVGSYNLYDGTTSTYVAFIYEAGSFTALPSAGTCTQGGAYGSPLQTVEIQVQPYDINNSGQIVGSTNACGVHRGFINSGSGYKTIHWYGANSTGASAINNKGEVVGTYQLPTLKTYGFTYSNGSISSFTYQDATRTNLSDINDIGFLLGGYSIHPWDAGTQIVYDANTFQFTNFIIPTVGTNQVVSFNDNGQILGYDVNGTISSPYVYDTLSGFSKINYPGAAKTEITAINNEGVIIGRYTLSDGTTSSFIATPDVAPALASLPLPKDTYNPPLVELDTPVRAELGAEGMSARFAGDFNNGGVNDLLVAHTDGNVIVYFGENPQDGLFNDSKSLPQIGSFGATIRSVNPGDFNNDGITDIVLGANNCRNNTKAFPVMLGNGDGSFTLAPCLIRSDLTGYIDTYIVGTQVGDFNEDGNDDIVIAVAGNYGYKGIYAYFGKNDGTFSNKQVIYDAGTSQYRIQKIAVDDFNNDGHLDVLYNSLASGYSNTALLLGDGTGAFPTSTGYLGAWPNGDDVVDINVDTYIDQISTENSGTVIRFGNPDGGLNYVPQTLSIPFATGRLIADMNADGLPDIVVFDTPFGGNAQAVVYHQIGVAQPVPDPAPVPDPTPIPAPAPAPDSGIPTIDPAGSTIESDGIIENVGVNYIIVSGIEIWYTNTTTIKYGDFNTFVVGVQVEFKGWGNPDGTIIADVIKAQ